MSHFIINIDIYPWLAGWCGARRRWSGRRRPGGTRLNLSKGGPTLVGGGGRAPTLVGGSGLLGQLLFDNVKWVRA